MQLYANPYQGSHLGFYFDSAEEFSAGMEKLEKKGIEEVEIDFIEGSNIEASLFEACKPQQAEVDAFFDLVDDVGDDKEEAAKVFFAVTHNGSEWKSIDTDDVIVHEGTLEEYAQQLIDDGIMPTHPEWYFDFDRFGEAIRDDVVEGAVEGARDQADEGEEDAEEELIREVYDRMSDIEIAEEYIEGAYRDVAKMPAKYILEYFDVEKFARDLDYEGMHTEFEFAGSTWVGENA